MASRSQPLHTSSGSQHLLVVTAKDATVGRKCRWLLQARIREPTAGRFENAPFSMSSIFCILRIANVVMLESRMLSNMAAVIFVSSTVSSKKSSTSSRGRLTYITYITYSAGMVASPMALRDNTRSSVVCVTNSVGYDVSGSPLIVSTHSDRSPTKTPGTYWDFVYSYFLPVPYAKFQEAIPDYIWQSIVPSEMVARKINAIKDNKSSGVDGIPPKILMETVEQINIARARLFNLSLIEKEVPFEWKEANIIPLFFF